MKLSCILDTCPKDKQFVNMFHCSVCKQNVLGGWNQPETGCVSCNHPEAIHKPDYERWQNMKACGAEVLAITMTRG